jgi:hypothetical protein
LHFLIAKVEKETGSMKKMFVAMAALAILTAGTISLPAQTTTPNPNPAPGAGQKKQGQRKGKKLGAQDGSGPVHQPGTGGGNGGGGRRGRR